MHDSFRNLVLRAAGYTRSPLDILRVNGVNVESERILRSC